MPFTRLDPPFVRCANATLFVTSCIATRSWRVGIFGRLARFVAKGSDRRISWGDFLVLRALAGAFSRIAFGYSSDNDGFKHGGPCPGGDPIALVPLALGSLAASTCVNMIAVGLVLDISSATLALSRSRAASPSRVSSADR